MAKLKIDWSDEARLDLFDILAFYIERNGNTNYSISLNAKIDKSIKLLSQFPFMGTATEYPSVRAFINNDYQIIYEIFDELILVIMIWDCRKDPIDTRIK